MKPRLLGPINLPVQSDVELHLHLLLYRHRRPVKPQEAYAALAGTFELTPEQRKARRLNSSGELAWSNLVRYAARRLRDNGFMDSTAPRGLRMLTAKGREHAEMIDSIDLDAIGL